MIQNEEDCLRSVAVEAGCRNPATLGGKDLGSQDPRW